MNTKENQGKKEEKPEGGGGPKAPSISVFFMALHGVWVSIVSHGVGSARRAWGALFSAFFIIIIILIIFIIFEF